MAKTYGRATSYVGREFDLLAMQDAAPVGEALLAQTIFSNEDAGQVCTGVQKLAQRWLLHMLTDRGSMPYNADDGTDLLAEARRGVWRIEADVIESYDFAAADVALYMAREEDDSMHPEDRFDHDELLSVALLPYSSVSLSVAIFSQAGDSRKVILPIPFSPITVG